MFQMLALTRFLLCFFLFCSPPFFEAWLFFFNLPPNNSDRASIASPGKRLHDVYKGFALLGYPVKGIGGPPLPSLAAPCAASDRNTSFSVDG
jgi:hypothetical protein